MDQAFFLGALAGTYVGCSDRILGMDLSSHPS